MGCSCPVATGCKAEGAGLLVTLSQAIQMFFDKEPVELFIMLKFIRIISIV